MRFGGGRFVWGVPPWEGLKWTILGGVHRGPNVKARETGVLGLSNLQNDHQKGGISPAKAEIRGRKSPERGGQAKFGSWAQPPASPQPRKLRQTSAKGASSSQCQVEALEWKGPFTPGSHCGFVAMENIRTPLPSPFSTSAS